MLGTNLQMLEKILKYFLRTQFIKKKKVWNIIHRVVLLGNTFDLIIRLVH